MRYGHGIPMTHLKLHSIKSLVLTSLYAIYLLKGYPLPIKAAKAADLKKLATQYLPANTRGMYIDLPTVKEDVEECGSDSAWFVKTKYVFIYCIPLLRMCACVLDYV